MEFLLWSFVGLAALALGSTLIVEGGYLMGRFYSWVRYCLRYRFPTWRSGRYVARLRRRHAGKAGSRLGQLRFTRSRAEQFDKKGS